MLQPIFRLIFVIGILIILTQNVLADSLDPEQIKALIEETKALRQEVSQLKKELAAHTKKHNKQSYHTQLISKQTRHSQKRPVKQATKKNQKKTEQVTQTKTKSTSKTTHSDRKSNPQNKNVPNLGGYFPIIAPYLGTTPSYDGMDLLTNLSQQNASLLTLQYRQEIENTFSAQKESEYYLILSGTLGGQIGRSKPYVGHSISDVDLVIANITGLAGIGKWITGFFSFDYDNVPLNGLNPPQFGPRVGNSRVYLDEGFITIGNLNTADWYLSMGQIYLPFGQYNAYTINSPLTASLFTTEERPVLLGYSHSTDITEFDATVYAYQGDTITSSQSSSINEWGASLDFLINKTKWSGEVSVAYIANVADAVGMQLNGQSVEFCSMFGGFAFPCRNGNVLAHRVPGFDAYGSLTLGPYNLVAEYITATRHFAPIDMTFNNKGARPSAFDMEAAYAFSIYDKPSSISLAYAFTKQALALLLPAREYTLTFTTSLWRNTTESIAFQHDINYGFFTTATGQGLPVFLPVDRVNLGKTSNTVLLAINAYF